MTEAKKQFLNGINHELMTADIDKELASLRKTNDVKSKEVLTWEKE